MPLEAHEIVARLEEWAEEVLKDPHTGLPPDAKLRIRPASAGTLVGHTGPRNDPPATGVRRRGFNLRFAFGSENDAEDAALADRFLAAIGADPTLGGRFDARDAELAEVRDGSPDEKAEAADEYGDNYAVVRIVRIAITDFI